MPVLAAPERRHHLEDRRPHRRSRESERCHVAQFGERIAKALEGARVGGGAAQRLEIEDVHLASQLVEQPGGARLLLLERDSLCHILHCAHQPHHRSVRVAEDLGLVMQHAHGAVGAEGTIVQVVPALDGRCGTQGGPDAVAILWMHVADQGLTGPVDHEILNAEDPVQLLGSSSQTGREIPLPTSDVRDPLRVGEGPFTPLERLCGDGGRLARSDRHDPEGEGIGEPHEQLDIVRAERIGLGRIDGERADHTVVGAQRHRHGRRVAALRRLRLPGGELGIEQEAPSDHGQAGTDRLAGRASAEERVGPADRDRVEVAGFITGMGDRTDGPLRIVLGEPYPRKPVVGLVDGDPTDGLEQCRLVLGSLQDALARSEDCQATAQGQWPRGHSVGWS